MTRRLPDGETARLLVWRWGQRNHRASLKRRTAPGFRHGGTLAGRFVLLLFPWTVPEYPGHRALFGAVLGLSPDYARRLLRSDGNLSAQSAVRLADFIRARIDALDEIERHLREHARLREVRRRPAGYVALRKRSSEGPQDDDGSGNRYTGPPV